MAKACKICRAVTQELDPTGRCQSCAMAKAATDSGTTYGKFMAKGGYSAPWGAPAFIAVPATPEGEKTTEGRKCDWCGKIFQPVAKTTRFCSEQCRQTGHRVEARERGRLRAGNVGDRFCLVCGKKIPPEVSWRRKTCPGECSYRHRMERRRQTDAKYRARKKEMTKND